MSNKGKEGEPAPEDLFRALGEPQTDEERELSRAHHVTSERAELKLRQQSGMPPRWPMYDENRDFYVENPQPKRDPLLIHEKMG